MYAFGLVLWEITRRTLTGDKVMPNILETVPNVPNVQVAQCDDYQLPYYQCVPSDPSFEDMFQVVCVQGTRPEVPARWHTSQLLRSKMTFFTKF